MKKEFTNPTIKFSFFNRENIATISTNLEQVQTNLGVSVENTKVMTVDEITGSI